MDIRTIGKTDYQPKQYNEQLVSDSHLLKLIKQRYGTRMAAAQAWGVSPAFVTYVLQGKRKVPGWMREELGLDAAQ